MKNQIVRIAAQPALINGEVNPNAGKIFTQKVDEKGTPKKDKNGDEYGQIRVDSVELALGYNKGINTRTAYISMTLKGWNISSSYYQVGQVVAGKIVRTESRTPMYQGHKPKMNIKTNQPVLIDGAAVYFQDKYTEDVNAQDELITSNSKNTTKSVLDAHLEIA